TGIVCSSRGRERAMMICTNRLVPAPLVEQSHAPGEDRDRSGGIAIEVRSHDAARAMGAPATDDLVRSDHEIDAEVMARLGQLLVEDLYGMNGGGDDRPRVDGA